MNIALGSISTNSSALNTAYIQQPVASRTHQITGLSISNQNPTNLSSSNSTQSQTLSKINSIIQSSTSAFSSPAFRNTLNPANSSSSSSAQYQNPMNSSSSSSAPYQNPTNLSSSNSTQSQTLSKINSIIQSSTSAFSSPAFRNTLNPANSSSSSSAQYQNPMNSSSSSSAQYQNPMNFSSSSSAQYQNPMNFSSSSSAQYQNPMNSSSSSSSQYQNPMNSSSSSSAQYQNPMNSSSSSSAQYQNPMNSSSSSSAQYQNPTNSSSSSSAQYQNPMNSSSSSSAQYQNPMNFSSSSSAQYQNPMNFSSSSSAQYQNPMNSSSSSSAQYQNPMNSSSLNIPQTLNASSLNNSSVNQIDLRFKIDNYNHYLAEYQNFNSSNNTLSDKNKQYYEEMGLILEMIKTAPLDVIASLNNKIIELNKKIENNKTSQIEASKYLSRIHNKMIKINNAFKELDPLGRNINELSSNEINKIMENPRIASHNSSSSRKRKVDVNTSANLSSSGMNDRVRSGIGSSSLSHVAVNNNTALATTSLSAQISNFEKFKIEFQLTFVSTVNQHRLKVLDSNGVVLKASSDIRSIERGSNVDKIGYVKFDSEKHSVVPMPSKSYYLRDEADEKKYYRVTIDKYDSDRSNEITYYFTDESFPQRHYILKDSKLLYPDHASISYIMKKYRDLGIISIGNS